VADSLVVHLEDPAGGNGELVLFVVLAVVTGLSVTWAVQPHDAWLEFNRTLAYLATFGAGVALARMLPGRWGALVGATLVAATLVSLYAVATKVFPATLNPGEVEARLREPFGYWNAVGLIAALGLQRPHLVVHDVGGTYGLAFTAMYPELISKLTILNTNFFPDYRWHFWGRVWRTPVLGDLVMLAAFRALFVNEMTKASPKLPREYAERAFASYGSKTRKMVLRYYRYMDSKRLEGWDVRLLKALETLPHQVLWGDLDPYIPKATADRFGGEVQHFADLGHWTMLEEPQQITSRLVAFARR